MRRPTTVLLHFEELDALYEAMGLREKVEAGCFDDWHDAGVPAKSYTGGISHIVKHIDAQGVHICATHRIFGADYSTVHWDIADIKVGDITLAKLHRLG